MIIAIDGPAGSGKSSSAKLVAKKLNFLHLDTGAMYRAATLYFLSNNISIESLFDKDIIGIYIDKFTIDFSFVSGNITLDNIDVSKEIRSNIVSENVSLVSSIFEVREKMVKLQRKISNGKNIVLDGRDIGTRVFPNAQFKFFLEADLNERSKRRYEELVKGGVVISIDEVKKQIKDRDYKDSNREYSPLTIAKDSIVIDTTNLTLKQQVDEILSIINKYLRVSL